ncbi:MAG: hypothetical protein KAX40_12260 [Herpetosiphon sp.]|nr:hypothetical protein [Herpetosiphon sp.]
MPEHERTSYKLLVNAIILAIMRFMWIVCYENTVSLWFDCAYPDAGELCYFNSNAIKHDSANAKRQPKHDGYRPNASADERAATKHDSDS